MIKGSLSLQASFFADLADCVPSADVIPPLLEAFRDVGFLPTTFIQVSEGKPHTRLRLAAPNQEWFVDLDVHRINVVKNPTEPWGANLGSVEEFARNASEYISRVLRIHTISGTRLALVTKELLDLADEGRVLEAYARAINQLPFYEKHSPHEWQARSVARATYDLAGRDEELNVISSISRVRGSFGTPKQVEEFDCIGTDFDINTYQKRTEPRFGIESLESFFSLATTLRSELLAQIGEKLGIA